MPQGFNPVPSSIQITRMLRRPPPVRVGVPSMIKAPAPHLMTPHMTAVPRMGRIGREAGGIVPIVDSPQSPHVGPIISPQLGRADDVPMHVPPGAYVVSAEDVAHLGQGNSVAGLAMLQKMFGPSLSMASNQMAGMSGPPLGGSGLPYTGGPYKPMHVGRGMPMPEPQKPKVSGFPEFRMGYPAYQGVQMGPTASGAHGGAVPPDGQPGTPINASGGEFVISPEEVKRRGHGDLELGHEALDAWVKGLRKEHIRTLQKLPGPAK
jgi:hypothetical protein